MHMKTHSRTIVIDESMHTCMITKTSNGSLSSQSV